MTDHDAIPKIGSYRGVPLEDQQNEARLVVVRRDIDAVFANLETRRLLSIVPNVCWAPESRLLAAAMLEAKMQIAAAERKVRPDFDLAYVRACVAGLNSRRWRSPTHFGSLLDVPPQPGAEGPAKRDEPLR